MSASETPALWTSIVKVLSPPPAVDRRRRRTSSSTLSWTSSTMSTESLPSALSSFEVTVAVLPTFEAESVAVSTL